MNLNEVNAESFYGACQRITIVISMTDPKLSDFFSLINEAHLELPKLLPELCEVCGKPAWECDCEETDLYIEHLKSKIDP
jgi:hypothetical protein